MYKLQENGMNVPAYIWSDSIEAGAIQQIKNASSLPFAIHHTVILPDGHQGYGAPIGGVMATENEIIPFFVGVDIGCGVLQGKVTVTEPICKEDLKEILGSIREDTAWIQ